MPESDSPEIEIDYGSEVMEARSSKPSPPLPEIIEKKLAVWVGPIANRIEDLVKSSAEHARLLERINGFDLLLEAQRKMLGNLDTRMEQQTDAMNHQVSQQMFSALHDELRGYKDDFFFDALVRPLLNELFGLYDVLDALSQQVAVARIAAFDFLDAEHVEALQITHIADNSENALSYLLEIFSRHGVEAMPEASGKLDKKLQRAVKVEPTEVPEQDQDVLKELRPGFTWRGRALRPADVVMARYTPPPVAVADDQDQGAE